GGDVLEAAGDQVVAGAAADVGVELGGQRLAEVQVGPVVAGAEVDADGDLPPQRVVQDVEDGVVAVAGVDHDAVDVADRLAERVDLGGDGVAAVVVNEDLVGQLVAGDGQRGAADGDGHVRHRAVTVFEGVDGGQEARGAALATGVLGFQLRATSIPDRKT